MEQQTKEIDLFKIFIWFLKSVLKHKITVIICVIAVIGFGIYKSKTSGDSVKAISHTSILHSNIPNVGAMYKLTSTLLQESKENLKSILLIDQADLQNLRSISIDTTYKPNILLKIEGTNEKSILYVKYAFLTYYNNTVKNDIGFEIEKASTIIKKFNNRTSGNLLNDSIINTDPVLFKDKDQVEAFEKGMDFMKRKRDLEESGAFTELKSYNTEVVSAQVNLTKTIIIHLIIGKLLGCLIAVFIEGFKKIKPLLND